MTQLEEDMEEIIFILEGAVDSIHLLLPQCYFYKLLVLCTGSSLTQKMETLTFFDLLPGSSCDD